MRIFLSAGEASGDMYGAWLIDALRDELRQRGEGEAEFFGVGGDAMRKAGCDIAVSAHEIAVVGLAEVVRHLPKIYRLFNQVVREIDRRPPDIAVLIDFPDFNLRLARQLHKRGVPVVYYVSPQLWAWRPSRVEQIRRYVSKMLVIFPFEQKFYAKHGINAEFVGHPLADAIASCDDSRGIRSAIRSRPSANLDGAPPWKSSGRSQPNLPDAARSGTTSRSRLRLHSAGRFDLERVVDEEFSAT